ncbi:MAG: hypothetical protein JWM14_1620 [Chitinophagaceae bacterium]|nr:hypothetical protein [Chitinophagaceae bacterium]
MKTAEKKNKAQSASDKKTSVQTPVPPQVQYPLESPDSKKNQQTKPGNQSDKK